MNSIIKDKAVRLALMALVGALISAAGNAVAVKYPAAAGIVVPLVGILAGAFHLTPSAQEKATEEARKAGNG